MFVLFIKNICEFLQICDASRGFLSSYAYILMVIYYLQHTKPAVLPCLQQMGPPRPSRMVDSWDAQFFEDTIENTVSG